MLQGNFSPKKTIVIFDKINDTFYKAFKEVISHNIRIIIPSQNQENDLIHFEFENITCDGVNEIVVFNFHASLFEIEEFIKINKVHPLECHNNRHFQVSLLISIITSYEQEVLHLSYLDPKKKKREKSILDFYIKKPYAFCLFYEHIYIKAQENPFTYPNFRELTPSQADALINFVHLKNKWPKCLVKALTHEDLNEKDKIEFKKIVYNYIINFHPRFNNTEILNPHLISSFIKLKTSFDFTSKFTDEITKQEYPNAIIFLLALERADKFQLAKNLFDSLLKSKQKLIIEELKTNMEYVEIINEFNNKHKLWKIISSPAPIQSNPFAEIDAPSPFKTTLPAHLKRKETSFDITRIQKSGDFTFLENPTNLNSPRNSNSNNKIHYTSYIKRILIIGTFSILCAIGIKFAVKSFTSKNEEASLLNNITNKLANSFNRFNLKQKMPNIRNKS
ncbi:MAG: hypothetical protein J0H68_02245 [Sphingobacteriia bacterium]|nr:hypothetical protein [Sphingobacteriia bacterium]